MLCLTSDDNFTTFERAHAPKAKAAARGPKIKGTSWAAQQEARMWREIEAKKRAKK